MASHNLQLSKEELAHALKMVGISMVTSKELDMAFRRYDDDKSGYINFDEFLDMQELFDGSLLQRQRRWYGVKKGVKRWFRKMLGSTSTTSTTTNGGNEDL